MNTAQFNQLQQALKLLAEADALVQSAMGACDECYSIHCAIEDVEDEICNVIRTADEEGIVKIVD
jgi:translation elongation factor EF-G